MIILSRPRDVAVASSSLTRVCALRREDEDVIRSTNTSRLLGSAHPDKCSLPMLFQSTRFVSGKLTCPSRKTCIRWRKLGAVVANAAWDCIAGLRIQRRRHCPPMGAGGGRGAQYLAYWQFLVLNTKKLRVRVSNKRTVLFNLE